MDARAYWWKEGDEIVVQNWIGGMMGQEHRHTPQEFEQWCQEAQGFEIIEIIEEGASTEKGEERWKLLN